MRKIWEDYRWIPATAVGSTIFALGFSLFLQPNEISPGGISGLALVAVELLGYGSVGVLTIIINLPLFILGGVKIGRRFFCGSLLGMILSSILIDAFAKVAMPPMDSLLCALYGGMICGLGLGMVFICGTSTGGSDIVVRLLKLKYRDVPIGQISMCFDAGVAVLTGIVFQDITKALYTGVAAFVTGKALDAVVYRFDYSKVALIITKEYDAVAEAIAKAWERRRTLRDEALFTTWLTRILIRVCVDMQRRQKRMIPTDEVTDRPTEREHISALREAIESLPQKERTMIVLYYMEGYDVRESAKLMGTTKGAVCAGLARAREKLRAYMEEDAR